MKAALRTKLSFALSTLYLNVEFLATLGLRKHYAWWLNRDLPINLNSFKQYPKLGSGQQIDKLDKKIMKKLKKSYFMSIDSILNIRTIHQKYYLFKTLGSFNDILSPFINTNDLKNFINLNF